MAGCHASCFVDSVLTAELAAADGADDNDADGNAERDDSMVGQRGRSRASEDWRDWGGVDLLLSQCTMTVAFVVIRQWH